MITLVYILTAVYILAINFYGFILLKTQQTTEESCDPTKIRDGKLIFTAFLGGSVGIIISSIVNKHRNKSMFIMVLMPILAVLNAYIIYLFLGSGVTYLFSPTTTQTAINLLRFIYFIINR